MGHQRCVPPQSLSNERHSFWPISRDTRNLQTGPHLPSPRVGLGLCPQTQGFLGATWKLPQAKCHYIGSDGYASVRPINTPQRQDTSCTMERPSFTGAHSTSVQKHQQRVPPEENRPGDGGKSSAFLGSFVQSFNNRLLNTYQVPDTVLSAGDRHKCK